MLNNHAPIVSILKEGFVKISGNISIDKENASKFEQKDKGFWLAINSERLR